MEKLSLVLPETPPYFPSQFRRCAVIGNSGDLLKTKFGNEIDGYEVVIRENGAPTQNYTDYVGRKSTFRLLNRGSAKALDKVVELDGIATCYLMSSTCCNAIMNYCNLTINAVSAEQRKEVLIIKTTVHDIMNKMIREVPIKNPVYLMLGASFGSAAKGTGLKALEFALSMCDSVDMYGFTLIKIHSPMRADLNRVVKWVPSHHIIRAARIASEKLLRRVGAGSEDPLAACSIIKKQVKRNLNAVSKLRKAALDHLRYVKRTTMYPLEHSPGHGSLCTVPTD
ncbi:Sialyltransferase-like protein 2 [Glycine max]|nr:Sialyltransferase-like protein 2 [Glycine max]